MRFKGFEGEWVKKRLGEVSKLITKGTTPNKFVNQGIKFIKIECFDGDKIDEQKCLLIDEQTHNKELKRSILEENDLLFAIAGATVGKVNIVKKEILPANTNQALAIIRLKEKENWNFIYQILKSEIMKKYIKDSIAVGAQPNLNLEQINDFLFFQPNFTEQQKIASFLTLIDERIQTQSKIIQRLETLMQGLREKLFTQKLRFKDGNGSPFPDWELKKGNDVFENISNKNHNSDLPILAITQEHGAIPRELIEYQISVTDKSVENYKVVEIGNFIISLRSFQGGIEYSSYKGICSPAYIILSNKIEIESLFYKYYFKTTSYIKLLNKKLEGIRDGKMISYTYFSDISLPYPSLREQSQISNFLSTVEGKIESEKTILEQYRNQKKFLLQNLFI